MAHVEHRGKNRWRARYIAPDGRERSKTFTRKVDAERFLAQVESSKMRGNWIDPNLGRTALQDLWERLEPKLARELRPSTITLYRGLWDRHIRPTLGLRALGSIVRLDIEDLVAQLCGQGVGAASIGATLRLLHRVFEAALRNHMVVANPVTGVSTPAVPHSEMRFLAPEEVERLTEAMPQEWKAFVMVAAWCGLRFGEIAALRVTRLDFEHRRIRVEETLSEVAGHLHIGPTKTKAKRSVTAPPFVMEALAAHLATRPAGPGELVFTSPEGGPVRRSNFRNRVWLPGLEVSGIGLLRFHDLRHTAVALAIAAGGHAKAIQSRLGHSSITMTLDRYGHLMDGLDLEVADRLEILRSTAWRRPGGPHRPFEESPRPDESGP